MRAKTTKELIEKIEREIATSKRIDDKVKNMQKEIIEQKRKQSAKSNVIAMLKAF